MLPYEHQVIQQYEAALEIQKITPKFLFGQRVLDAEAKELNSGYGLLIIKGMRFLAEPTEEENGKITYKSPSGEAPMWEYHCYELIGYHEIGWFKENKLSTNDAISDSWEEKTKGETMQEQTITKLFQEYLDVEEVLVNVGNAKTDLRQKIRQKVVEGASSKIVWKDKKGKTLLTEVNCASASITFEEVTVID